MASIKARNNSIDILKGYNGKNPYILSLKRDVIVLKKIDMLNDFAVEYVNMNYNYVPKEINKMVHMADWWAENKKEEWNLEFLPEKLFIYSIIGETSTAYHCLVQYRKSVGPSLKFLSKRAVLNNFLVEDYHNVTVDFDRYDKLSMLRDPNRKIKEHQKEGVKFLLSRKKCILADDMGYGKTLELIVAAIEGNFDSVLIVCPASIKSTWKDELLWYVPERDITVIEGINDKNKSELEQYLGYGIGKSGKKVSELKEEAKERGKWSDNRFVIVNYDILEEFYEIPVTRSKENVQKAFENSPMLQYIYGRKSLIIIDEAHRLSNTTSHRYKILKDLIKRGNPDSIYEATGTPITNNPMNFFNVLQLIGAEVSNDYNYYVKRYCNGFEIPAKGEKEKWSNIYMREHGIFNKFSVGKEDERDMKHFIRENARMILVPSGESNLDELKMRTEHIYLRRVKEDLKDMVKKTIHELFYDLTFEEEVKYNQLWDEYETAQLEADPTKEINKELIEGGIYRRYLSVCMVPHTIELVDQLLETGEKVVIGCCYDDELYQLKDYYGDMCVIYNGKLTPKEKDRNKDRFMNEPDCKVLIGNIQAAGVGLTLVAATKLVFSNFSYVPGDNKQFMDRIHRINQTKDVDVYFQIFRGTQYEKMWEIIMKKALVIDAVIKKEDDK